VDDQVLQLAGAHQRPRVECLAALDDALGDFEIGGDRELPELGDRGIGAVAGTRRDVDQDRAPAATRVLDSR